MTSITFWEHTKHALTGRLKPKWDGAVIRLDNFEYPQTEPQFCIYLTIAEAAETCRLIQAEIKNALENGPAVGADQLK